MQIIEQTGLWPDGIQWQLGAAGDQRAQYFDRRARNRRSSEFRRTPGNWSRSLRQNGSCNRFTRVLQEGVPVLGIKWSIEPIFKQRRRANICAQGKSSADSGEQT